MGIEGFTPFPPELVATYVERGVWRNWVLSDLLDHKAQEMPEKEALVDWRSRTTYGQLALEADRLALGLLDIGLRPRDRVVVQLPNWKEFVVLFFGLAKMGAIIVPALPQHRTRDIGHLVRLTEAVALVTPVEFRGFRYAEMVEEARSQTATLRWLFNVGDEPGTKAFAVEKLLTDPIEKRYATGYLKQFRPDPNEVAIILSTGGTTGDPKGVPHTHNDYVYTGEGFARPYPPTPDDAVMVIFPLAHNAGISVNLLPGIMGGAKIVLVQIPRPSEVLPAIQRERVTTTGMAPTMSIDLLNHPDFDKYDLSSLRLIHCGASHVPPELVRKLREKLGCEIANGFGMAEGPRTNTFFGDPPAMASYTVGRTGSAWDELLIVDDDGHELPPGEEGELLARGPGVFRGYYKSPEVNKKEFREDGFFHTGDYACIDADGNLRITGRKKDVIIRGGENISAGEVEGLLLEHPKIENVAVVGMPDSRLGEKVCAFIVPKPGQTVVLDDIKAFLQIKQVAIFKWPERLEVVEEFPLTNVGKVLKRELQQRLRTLLQAEAGPGAA